MRIVRISLWLAACALLVSLILEQLPPFGAMMHHGFSWVLADPVIYGAAEETINVTEEEIAAAGSEMGFEFAGIGRSPTVLIPGSERLEKAVISSLSRCPAEITMEQYCHASDLLGFLDIRNGTKLGSAKYGILSPYHGFWLKIALSDPPEYFVDYPPSAEIWGRIYTRMIAGALGPEPAERLDASAGYRIDRTEQIPEMRCNDLGCLNGENVTVELSYAAVFSTGHVFKREQNSVEFFFAEHPGCERQQQNGVFVEHCRENGKYRVRAWVEGGRDPQDFTIRGFLTRAEIGYQGYHGNSTRLIADCHQLVREHYGSGDERWYYLSGRAEILLQNGNESTWNGETFIPIFRCADCATEVSCTLYLSDSVSVPFTSFERKCPAGNFSYHYRPPYCERDGSCLPAVELSNFSGVSAPEHAKKPYSCQSNAAEEFVLRALAEAVKKKTADKVREVLERAARENFWNKYFDRLNEKAAKELLQYFYLVQIPLSIERDDSVNCTELEAIVRKKGNESIIYALSVLFENTTRQNTSETLCAVTGNWSTATKCRASFIQLEAGSFGKTLYESLCGKYFVAELAQIRKPSVLEASKYIKIPEKILFARGYSPSPGVEYPRSEYCGT